MEEFIITVKCINCGLVKEVIKDSIAYGDVVMCDECFNPMIGEKSIVRQGKEIIKEEWI